MVVLPPLASRFVHMSRRCYVHCYLPPLVAERHMAGGRNHSSSIQKVCIAILPLNPKGYYAELHLEGVGVLVCKKQSTWAINKLIRSARLCSPCTPNLLHLE